jgi:hypothetical protein
MATTGDFRWQLTILIPSLAVVWAILLWEELTTRELLVNALGPKTFNPNLLQAHVPRGNSRVGRRHRDVVQGEERNNVTVYSEHFPFLGAGDKLRTWAFTVDLSQGSNRPDGQPQQPESFAISALHDFVAARLHDLRSAELDHKQQLKGLTIEDRLFVSGGAVHLDSRLLPNPERPPQAWVEPGIVRHIMDNPTGVVRHFKCIRVESWVREIALSVFLHFTIDGKTLYVEQTACVLFPIRAEYHVVDSLARNPLPGERWSLYGAALKDVPASLLRAPVELLASVRSEQQEYKQYRKFRAMLRAHLPIDCGARVSVRELAAAEDFHNYFQELDSYRHLKIIELHTLTAILDFLQDKRVDTSEFRARQATILNTGIFMPGGMISGSTVAGGPGATAASSPGPSTTAGSAPAQNRKE